MSKNVIDLIKTGNLQEFKEAFSNLDYKEEVWFRGDTPLHEAAYQGRIDIIEYLLETDGIKEQIDVNAVNRAFAFPLHYAAQEGHIEICQKLLLNGANLGAGFRYIPEVEPRLRTPLHYAAGAGKLEVVKLFVHLGASIEAKDFEGRTSIDYANEGAHPDVVSFLNQELVVQQQSNNSENNFSATSVDESHLSDSESISEQDVTGTINDITQE